MVIEKGYVDANYRDTYFNFFSRKFAQYELSHLTRQIVRVFFCLGGPHFLLIFSLSRLF